MLDNSTSYFTVQRMGLLKNFRLLFDDSLLERMLSLERRQELLEDYTDQKLDSMKSYSGRVLKRERDASKKPEANENGGTHDGTLDPRIARLYARRGSRASSLPGVA